MTATTNKPADPELQRENLNTLRILGGLLMLVALLIFFFHLAESPMGHHALGSLAALFAVVGATVYLTGHFRLRAMR
ncbi:MAG: hypothetical protein P4M01_02115 [Acidobacteriota bacterium]|nr:hypothetical protein [Acidobacteriota bacterium]